MSIRRCNESVPTPGLLCAFALIVGLVSQGGAAAAARPAAQVPTEETRIQLDIPPEPLRAALTAFAKQSGLQLVYTPEDVRPDEMSPGVSGSYTADAALTRILRNSELSYHYINARTVAIRSAKAYELELSQTAERKDVGPPAKEGDDSSSGTEGKEWRAARLQEVVVTGSRLPTTSKEGVQEVRIYDREAIDQSGQTSVADFLSTLPEVPVMSDDETSGAGEPYSTVRLRGLPAGTTLVLLNGRRLENSGLTAGAGTFFNLDDIPLAAVQRIEIDPNGSSAVYGSDAIAGVVNIILKKDFNGFAANAKYGWAKDTDTVRTDVALGKQWSNAGLSIVGSYETESGLMYSDRLLTASQDYRSFGGSDGNYPVCSPGNVFSVDGTPLPGAPAGSAATYAAVSGTASSGKPPLSQFAYRTLNECSILSGSALLPSRHRAGVLMEGHLDVAPNVEIFTEVIYSHLHQVETLSNRSLFGVPGYQQFTVSAANPYNPFGETVGVAELLPSIPVAEVVDTDFFRPLLGVKGTLDQRWQWEISAWQSSDWNEQVVTNELSNPAAIQSALDSSNPAMALNPFVNGPIAPQSVIGSLFGNTDAKVMARDRSAEAFVRGPVLSLPAGNVEGVIGSDYVQSVLNNNLIDDGFDPPNTRLDYGRRYSAVFGEAKVPVIGALGHLQNDMLSLMVAGRHDHYSDFGSANTDQFGVEFRPVNSLLIRGTYADAFDAPTLTTLYTADITGEALITNPVTGAPELVQVASGGNRGLQPMTGHSHTVGIVYSSAAIPGLLASVTQWSVVENDVIQPVAAQVIVDNSRSFPGRVLTNSVGQIVEVNDTYVNFGSIDVAGVDYELIYSHELGNGRFSVDLDGVETYRYRQALAAGTQPVESVSIGEDDGDWAPRWKGTAGIGWKQRVVSVHLDGRYTGSYMDYDSTSRIGNFWIFDANARADGEAAFANSNNWLRDAYIEVGATNLFNRAPQFSNYGFDLSGYDPSQMSVVGRAIYAEIGGHW